MQKKLYSWLIDIMNIVALSSLFLLYPRWVGVTAGLICFSDYWIKRQSGK